ncbi:MAG: UDP-N-acetylmuramate--L-alanine ligase [Candidatus Kerfeldbacteria bacterium CG_4_10_14_0_8_um_filter_42_10]|uniref:UDP-N-acetylmuramate--L-alanine ligase n=1 Tax=Candidatus Kerfeldbacteria bacterium CG_4_10_14_0_8_um_filter_42_10 TaxID=2014248 RepID=A0A2M7RKI4_9BACT|nr:MAG: UDP-N-acetylmuramate--L-alanine ligase [Candidatus Kerfeldbacteria bacterium CG_4_10_14_0_8_um_filter_42_10]
MSFENLKKIHFIGIAGIGMSALAAMAKKLGYQVTGSDGAAYPPATTVLAENNIIFFEDYQEEHISDQDLVVIGAGQEPANNIEVRAVMRKGIRIVSFAELLYFFTKDKFRIVITGTHGKTTTASLIAWALNSSDQKTGFFLGGYSKDLKTNYALSASQNFVIEGDEYYSSFFDKRPKFLHYRPALLVITNLDMDHYDYYKNLTDLVDKFRKCIKMLPPEGVIIACHDDKNVRKLLKDSDHKIIWYGLKGKQLNWKGEKITYADNLMRFTANNLAAKEKVPVELKILGAHNALNCLAAIAVLDHLKIPYDAFKKSLFDFQGSQRRFEKRGEIGGVMVIDDYAHHPTAVKATLDTARSVFPNRRIWAIFEPHTFSRTKATINQLAQSFGSADQVIIPDIYPAREKSKKGNVTASMVVDEIKKNQQNVYYLPTKEKVLAYLVKETRPQDVVIVMAVGNFNQIADLLLERLSSK